MRSCNPVFYEIGLQLYNTQDDALSKWARLYGFGAPTGMLGLYEEGGLVPDSKWKESERGEPWYPGDEVNLAIGQGDLLITPLQLANAYVTFANRELRAPVILAGVAPEARGALPLTDDQWNHLLYGLQLVTGPGGTANTTFAGYSGFAGKSGTAEDAGEQQHVLFVAMAPALAPAAVAAVVLDDGESGSREAGPIARDAVLAALDQ
jgi:penicillin-binding protein 2